ncbi:FAD/NAD(P)-binding domain-containing protein [Aspergillus ibericus CBS 121593]|uniref:FAD/NAD(P)-binding domain-containing protein n=1 Tax=Aspergillus ibericus CBS 121593 TaxID=1448316 RepID=A0A395GRE2_9EURO|nr:FAD/NAD(P)-binding domain-containing protein [Aspergillus ibericus CBS 121593]RAK97277.1 FAD/NAD(P)-binding domain-containing protein [Aspergillus ibericus CBS 121593]
MSQSEIDIAIIGCGIIGAILALGLIKSNEAQPRAKLNIKVYEQAASPREYGAGIGFTATARKCMTLMDERIADCVGVVATLNGEPENPDYSMRFVDGFRTFPTPQHEGYGGHSQTAEDIEEDVSIHGKVYKLYVGPRGFEGCHRAQFLAEVMKLMPEGIAQFKKRVEGFEYLETGRVRLDFADGEQKECDIVIACDGIRSRMRELLFTPAYNAQYTHQLAFRGLVPMDAAIQRLSRYRALRQHMQCGPNAHIMHFPVAGQKLMNVVAFVQDPNEWSSTGMTTPAQKSEVVEAFREWGPFVRALIDLLPENLDKWAVFDTYDCPIPRYVEHRVALAGDAAHASSPHHGAGAGMGVEDALALVAALTRARVDVDRGVAVGRTLEAALKAYSKVRYGRSQWLVRSSRQLGWTFEWMNPDTGAEMDRAFVDIRDRSHQVWHFDVEGMVAEVEREYRQML